MADLVQSIKDKFPFLPEDKLFAVLSLGEMVVLEESQVFIHAGERSRKVGLVIEGMMRNYLTDENGEEVTVLFAVEMQTITPYKTLYLDALATETSAAIEKTLLFVFDFQDFKKMAINDPTVMMIYVQMMEATLVAAIHRIEDFTQRSPEQRYERILHTETFLIDRAPLKYLASYLGITPVSLSRIRKRMSQKK
ncbi:MAG: Crp/Fnr family transcriptional regulator [Bacteroidetes bacterium]|nr:Crp/Fnr family transcriptional regulator [Bacteroidota bacterium]